MKYKNAVITGAACGIGKSLAKKCSKLGMSVVLADIDEKKMLETKEEFKKYNNEIYTFVVDVSDTDQVKKLSEYCKDKLGNVHLLFNNAGVSMGGKIWEFDVKDWQWVLGVNLWGVINGVMHFVPDMISHGENAHIINTSSITGFTSPPYIAGYNLSKHGVISLSETLQHELSIEGHNINVSILCPDFVSTEIMESKRNRPDSMKTNIKSEMSEEDREKWRNSVKDGMDPDAVADITIEHILNNKFYIFTHNDEKENMTKRFSSILEGRNPVDPHANQWEH